MLPFSGLLFFAASGALPYSHASFLWSYNYIHVCRSYLNVRSTPYLSIVSVNWNPPWYSNRFPFPLPCGSAFASATSSAIGRGFRLISALGPWSIVLWQRRRIDGPIIWCYLLLPQLQYQTFLSFIILSDPNLLFIRVGPGTDVFSALLFSCCLSIVPCVYTQRFRPPHCLRKGQ